MLLIKIYILQLQSDYAFTLKSENELLNQDILTLEEELTKSKEERDKVGFCLFYLCLEISFTSLCLKRFSFINMT